MKAKKTKKNHTSQKIDNPNGSGEHFTKLRLSLQEIQENPSHHYLLESSIISSKADKYPGLQQIVIEKNGNKLLISMWKALLFGERSPTNLKVCSISYTRLISIFSI